MVSLSLCTIANAGKGFSPRGNVQDSTSTLYTVQHCCRSTILCRMYLAGRNQENSTERSHIRAVFVTLYVIYGITYVITTDFTWQLLSFNE